MTDQDRREALANDAAWQSGYARGRADCARERDELRAAGWSALRGYHLAAFPGHGHPVEDCPLSRFADLVAALHHKDGADE